MALIDLKAISKQHLKQCAASKKTEKERYQL